MYKYRKTVMSIQIIDNDNSKILIDFSGADKDFIIIKNETIETLLKKFNNYKRFKKLN